jgi:hypothetical protein
MIAFKTREVFVPTKMVGTGEVCLHPNYPSFDNPIVSVIHHDNASRYFRFGTKDGAVSQHPCASKAEIALI